MEYDSSNGARYVFLDYLRACAAWLVVWDHLGTLMPSWSGSVFAPAQWIQRNIAEPLGIIQNFGWLGVALFFLISGFIISDRARVEGVGEFIVRRVFRVYPMLAFAVLLSAVFLIPRAQLTPVNVLLNLTLANYLFVPQIVLLGVAWTLVIEVIFYVLTAATQFARESPHRIAINLAVVSLLISMRGAFGPNFFLLAVAASYLPILVMGQTVYWWLAKARLTVPWGVAYLLASCGIFVWGLQAMQPGFLPLKNSYLISVCYALIIFTVSMRMSLRPRAIVRVLSDTSYSMYLLHGIVGLLALKVLMKSVPLSLAIPAAAAASLAASFVTYRLIEVPSQRLGRYLSRRPRRVFRRTPLDGGATSIIE